MNVNESESIFRAASPEDLQQRALQNPSMFSNAIQALIEEKIRALETEYQHAQGLILTESDLKCLLCSKLAEIPELHRSSTTRDSHIKANSIHTELPWYDENRKLTIKPDITLLEPARLSILRGYGLHPWKGLPSKGCSYDGDAIIFELKFIRARSGITQQKLEGSIKKDHEKIKRLFRRLDSDGYSHRVFCYFIVFNKTDIKCTEFDAFKSFLNRDAKCKMIYATGRIS